MIKKAVYIPVVFIVLGLLFLGVSFLVYLTKGKDSLIKRKLRIGALLLTITGFSITGCSGGGGVVSCYIGPAPNNFILETQYPSSAINVNLAHTNILHGEIRYRINTNYSFRLMDTGNTVIQTNELFADDGVYDTATEQFSLSLTNAVQTGEYKLYFYNKTAAEQNADPQTAYDYNGVFTLSIISNL